MKKKKTGKEIEEEFVMYLLQNVQRRFTSVIHQKIVQRYNIFTGNKCC